MTTRKVSLTGVMFIILGQLILAGQFTPLRLWTLPLLAVLFIAWGFWVRQAGLFIPAGVLGGLALGIGLETSPLSPNQPEGAGFFLGFAAGWLLIPLLTALLGERRLWPLIPGGILGLFGLALLVGGPAMTAIEWLGKLWPLIFVAIGIRLLWRTPDHPTNETH
ncbi:MAG: hypothetical protein Fur0018_20560 [Anaerolineales bacterium]